jgi:type IV pilus assembly protein PilQ
MRALMRSNREWAEGGRARRLLTLLVIVALAVSAQTRAGTLEDIRFSSLPNDVTQIELRFDSAPPDPSGYTIDQPARIAIDLDGVTSALASRYHSLGTGNARSVTVVEADQRLRVIVNLTRLVPYETRVRGNSLFLDVGSIGESSGPVA